MNLSFSGKAVLVAGGTGGLGRAVSLAFIKEGAKVYVPYRSQKEFASLVGEAGADGVSVQGEQMDVTDEIAVARLIDRIVAAHGQLDVMVNAVGGYAGGTQLWKMDPKTLDQMLTLNLRAGFVLSRVATAQMLKQKAGAIVNVASKAAVDHGAGAAAYAASKAAAVAMIDSLAAEVKGSGIRVNSVLPSIIDTTTNRNAMPDSDFTKWPKPEEIAHVILFLCSDEAKVIHGASVPVYGES